MNTTRKNRDGIMTNQTCKGGQVMRVTTIFMIVILFCVQLSSHVVYAQNNPQNQDRQNQRSIQQVQDQQNQQNSNNQDNQEQEFPPSAAVIGVSSTPTAGSGNSAVSIYPTHTLVALFPVISYMLTLMLAAAVWLM